jgi:hypothetical protein
VCVLAETVRRYWRHILCSLFIFVAAFVLQKWAREMEFPECCYGNRRTFDLKMLQQTKIEFVRGTKLSVDWRTDRRTLQEMTETQRIQQVNEPYV